MSVAARWQHQDLLHAVVLPDLPARNDDLFAKKTEYTESQARQIDLAGLPILINHDEYVGRVGETVAYAVRDGSDGSPARAEVLFVLDSERGVDPAHLNRLDFQRNALMNGAHRDISLGHTYDVLRAPAGVHRASAEAPDSVIRKAALEISTCSVGKRSGSHILAYFPCAETLRAATERAVRSFCNQHNYVPPPVGINGAEWTHHVESVVDQVSRRRDQLLAREVIGYHRASATGCTIEVHVPWHFANTPPASVPVAPTGTPALTSMPADAPTEPVPAGTPAVAMQVDSTPAPVAVPASTNAG